MSRGRRRSTGQDVPMVQWIVATIALVVVVASFGFVVYEGLVRQATPAQPEAVIDSVRTVGSAYHLHVTAVNRGGDAAADVEVRAIVTGMQPGADGGVLRFEYLPGGASASGVLVLTEDPRVRGVRVEVTAYREP